MTDLRYLLETALLLAVPFVPVVIGVLLRRKFPPAPSVEGAAPLTGAQKAGRLAGTILLWGGAAGILFMIVVVLNFKGKI
ncbi:MAG: hypothetical protein A3J79_12190 [Elusimicrobia bacterium RIFOXYB2_FULL_62_6]|nr:MAG: hypothetical protein A3J79_12190 [Elusimicrobia bacterium RIFOXYB2_FULL_62_6]